MPQALVWVGEDHRIQEKRERDELTFPERNQILGYISLLAKFSKPTLRCSPFPLCIDARLE